MLMECLWNINGMSVECSWTVAGRSSQHGVRIHGISRCCCRRVLASDSTGMTLRLEGTINPSIVVLTRIVSTPSLIIVLYISQGMFMFVTKSCLQLSRKDRRR